MRLALLVMLLSSVASAQEAVRWSFDKTDTAQVAVPRVSVAPELAPGAKAAFSDEVPGAFIYDPLARTSRPNLASRCFSGTEQTSDAIQASANLRVSRHMNA